MEFRFADTFSSGLARLTGEEQKAVKTAAFDMQLNPANPGLQFHKLDRAKDKAFWSVRAGRDIRIIVHRSESSLLLCYVDHHDKAYQWAERRKIERHPSTGAMQIVELRELVREIEVFEPVAAPAAEPTGAAPALEGCTAEQLLSYGVPEEWVADLLKADEDELLQLAEHLPAEAAEAVLNLATGTVPTVPAAAPVGSDPFAHPDAQRRFRVVTDVEELKLALEYPWERWAVFLHPAQRDIVERSFNGPARVGGSAGTGKTVVALHRAAHLARSTGGRVLLTTFSVQLARLLRQRMDCLVGADTEVRQRIVVRSLDELGLAEYERAFGQAKLVTPSMLRKLLRDAAEDEESGAHSLDFLVSEWNEVVDAWQLDTWELYRDVARLGRRTRLPESRRRSLWDVFERVRQSLQSQGLVTAAMVFGALTLQASTGEHAPADHVVVDEAQDVSVPQLRYLAAIAGGRPNGLFFAGDVGQRIFRTPFSWVSLGVDVRGRSHTLRVNYRTSHQIRRKADVLLDRVLSDVDGTAEDRSGTVSVLTGPEPEVLLAESAEREAEAVGEWIRARLRDGVRPEEVLVVVRSAEEMPRAKAAAKAAGFEGVELRSDGVQPENTIAVCTMHEAKGLEFRAVVVAACDDEVVPSQARISSVTDGADLQAVYETERHLLYVACTRARDHLLVTAVEPASEFLDDLRAER